MKPASCPTTSPECTWGNRGQGAAGTQGLLTVGAGTGPTSFSRDTSAPSHRQRNGLREREGAPSTCQLARDSWLLHLSSPWTQIPGAALLGLHLEGSLPWGSSSSESSWECPVPGSPNLGILRGLDCQKKHEPFLAAACS